jgi:hypothetical protein
LYNIDALGLHELQLLNENDDYTVSFDILYIDQIMGGDFDKSNIFPDQSFIIKHNALGDEAVEIGKVEGNIYQQKDTTFLNATVYGLDGYVYEVSMFYTIPTPTETITYNFTEEEVTTTNALPQGIFIFETMNKNGSVMTKIYIKNITTGNIRGTFICDGKFVENQFESFETFVEVYNENTRTYDKYYMQQGEMTITIDENNMIQATANFICDDAKRYIINLTAPFERPRLKYDTEDEGVNFTYGMDTELIVDSTYLKSNGYITYILFAEHPYNETVLVFFIDETDPEIIIPEGVYPFGTYGSQGHVLASRGMGEDGSPLPSYYVTANEFGHAYGYFLVDGTVTVENINGHIRMSINAVNSYDLPVKILYDPTLTALEDVNSPSVKANKELRHGQLIIRYNGHEFNAQGAILK